MAVQKYTIEPIVDERFYDARTARNLGWLGDDETSAREAQLKIASCIVGVAGCGGIGGGVIERLARLGVKHLRIADFDTFEYSNINRQLGAGIDTIGRNKADVVAEFVNAMCPDIRIDVFTDGITDDTAEEFASGCDYILDEIEPYAVGARYSLHQAFRKSDKCEFMMTAHVYGDRTFVWKWTRDGIRLEDLLGVPAKESYDVGELQTLLSRLIPQWQTWPPRDYQAYWLIQNATCPIIPGAVPMAQGLLVERLTQAITEIEKVGDSVAFPAAPGYGMVDSRTWTAQLVHGKWW